MPGPDPARLARISLYCYHTPAICELQAHWIVPPHIRLRRLTAAPEREPMIRPALPTPRPPPSHRSSAHPPGDYRHHWQVAHAPVANTYQASCYRCGAQLAFPVLDDPPDFNGVTLIHENGADLRAEPQAVSRSWNGAWPDADEAPEPLTSFWVQR